MRLLPSCRGDPVFLCCVIVLLSDVWSGGTKDRVTEGDDLVRTGSSVWSRQPKQAVC